MQSRVQRALLAEEVVSASEVPAGAAVLLASACCSVLLLTPVSLCAQLACEHGLIGCALNPKPRQASTKQLDTLLSWST